MSIGGLTKRNSRSIIRNRAATGAAQQQEETKMTTIEAMQALAALQARKWTPSDEERERARCIVWAARIHTFERIA